MSHTASCPSSHAHSRCPPSPARALPPHYLMDPPCLCPGFFTDPHYFQSPSLVKSNLATYYRSDKTALGSASPGEEPGCFQAFIPPLPCRLRSLWAEPPRGAFSRNIPASISSPGILISRPVNYITGHPLPSPLAPLSPALQPRCPKLLALLPALCGAARGTRLSQILLVAAGFVPSEARPHP